MKHNMDKKNAEDKLRQLSDEDLDKVAGGASIPPEDEGEGGFVRPYPQHPNMGETHTGG